MAEYPVFGKNKIFRTDIELLRKRPADLRFQLLSGILCGVAGHKGNPARITAKINRCEQGVGREHEYVIHRDAQHLGDDDGQHGIAALADVAGAGGNEHPAVKINL